MKLTPAFLHELPADKPIGTAHCVTLLNGRAGWIAFRYVDGVDSGTCAVFVDDLPLELEENSFAEFEGSFEAWRTSQYGALSPVMETTLETTLEVAR